MLSIFSQLTVYIIRKLNSFGIFENLGAARGLYYLHAKTSAFRGMFPAYTKPASAAWTHNRTESVATPFVTLRLNSVVFPVEVTGMTRQVGLSREYSLVPNHFRLFELNFSLTSPHFSSSPHADSPNLDIILTIHFQLSDI
jgi:hypothetical protein